jgi:gliding motility-associated-like protein
MKFKKFTKHLFTFILMCELLFPFAAKAQMTVTDGITAEELAAILTGEGVTVFNATMNATCPLVARGKFEFATSPSDIGIDTGIVLTTGRAKTTTSGFEFGVNAGVFSQAAYSFPSGFGFAPGDDDLDDLLSSFGSSVTTNDACVLEFDFIPAGDTVKFDYVFGSEEYPEYACATVNDIFGFFISGGAYTGLNNIALIPGTDIPVTVNTINKAPDGMLFGTMGNCTSMGTGSPFSEFYVDNLDLLGSEEVVYDGFTTVLQAVAGVSPCDTYHLKIAIADGGDATYDSGVFLKAGSLTSTAITVKTYGGAGFEVPYTNTVRGCPPGKVVVSRSGNIAEAVTVEYMLGGTAVNGVDYEEIPLSVVIPAGSSEAEIWIDPISLPAPVGPKSVIVDILSPYTCGGEPKILGSDTILIFDSIYVNILNNDTAICPGESVNLQVETDSLFTLSWVPAATVSDPAGREVVVTPDGPTNYTVSVTVSGGVACPPATDKVFVDVKTPPSVDLGPDRALCIGTEIPLNPIINPTPEENPDYVFNWSPATGLSDPTILNPIASPVGDITYILRVNPGAEGCDGTDTVRLRVLPDDIVLVNRDTIVCKDEVINLLAVGDTAFTYRWTPETNVGDPTDPTTFLTATESGNVTITASYPGCDDMVHSFYLEVQPNPQVNIGEDMIICSYDTVHMHADVYPASYPHYSFEWNPGVKMNDSTLQNPVYHSYTSDKIIATVRTPIGCVGRDSIYMTVNTADFMFLNTLDTGFCPPNAVPLIAVGAASYQWLPEYGLSDATVGNPIAQPQSTTEYLIMGTSEAGCVDSQYVMVNVYPGAVMNLPDSVQIWPGESYQMDPQSNALYFQWFPSAGLTATDISNPIASPEVRTRYFVTAVTEHGCSFMDSVDVLVNTESILDAPNAFAPGNGTNGTFKVVKRGLATLKTFAVYNRWGTKVFETTDINQGWDGRYNGSPQPAGVYIYHIEAMTSTGKHFIKSGNVTLIR